MAKLTPMKAIRKKCLECCCGQIKEVRECNMKSCALHAYRSGHRPKTEKLSQRMLKLKKRKLWQ